MPRNATKAAIRSKYAYAGALAGRPISHFSCHETGANVGVTGVTRGNPTVIGAASTSTLRPRQWVRIISIGGATGVNGIRRVLKVTPTTITVDYDSSAEAAYTTGGSVNPTCLADAFGNLDGIEMSSAASVLWSTAGQLNCDATNGTSSAALQTNTGHCDIAASDDLFVFAVRASIVSNPTTNEEPIFTYGINSPSQTNSKYGEFKLSINTSGVMQVSFRRAASADSGGSGIGSNQSISCFGGALASGVKETFVWACDPVTATSYWYRGGVLVNTDALTTNGTGWPSAESIGWVIGAQISAPGTISTSIVAGKAGSGITISRLLFGKAPFGPDKLAAFAYQFEKYGGFPKILAGLGA